jgi:hypothetical protein
VAGLLIALTGAAIDAREARPPLDACAMLPEADALALLPGAKQVEQQATAAQPADREVSGCAYHDRADASRRVTLSIQRFPNAVPTEIGLAIFNDHELEPVEGVARGALWKESTATMMLVLKIEFITLTVTRPEAPATMEEVRAAMKAVYERLGASVPERSPTAP